MTLCKNGSIWNTDVNNTSVLSLSGWLLLFLNKWDNFAKKNEEVYNPTIKKVLETINDIPHQLFAEGLQIRDLYPKLKKTFARTTPMRHEGSFNEQNWAMGSYMFKYWQHSSWQWRSSRKKLHFPQNWKTSKSSSADLTCHVFSLEDAVTHVAVSNPSGILTVEN